MKKKITKDFLGFKKDERPQTERVHGVLNKIDILKPISRHIIKILENKKTKAKL